MSKGALEGERTMTQMVPALQQLTKGVSGWAGAAGWEAGASDILMYETYFDTSGYALSDLTVFPMGALLQDPGRYTCTNPNVAVQVVDMICSERISHTDAYDWITRNTMPGMVGTTMDFSQILWGQYRTLLGQASFQAQATEYLTASSGLFGSGQPSTAEKLWCYRFIVVVNSQENDIIDVPASRFVLSAIIAAEKELAFLMRQKRSYELAT
jgi:hypothetical protein